MSNSSSTRMVTVGVLAYFVFAIIAHSMAGFLKQEFWINCLGMTSVNAVIPALKAAAM
ncbi:MAG: hypothetical protein Q3976_08570 [Corynebacterium sp.]|nr:hypothetical protein [Corynebacterium sp.]